MLPELLPQGEPPLFLPLLELTAPGELRAAGPFGMGKWIDADVILFLCGSTRVGKSRLASALGQHGLSKPLRPLFDTFQICLPILRSPAADITRSKKKRAYFSLPAFAACS
jgi:hypothetical protein